MAGQRTQIARRAYELRKPRELLGRNRTTPQGGVSLQQSRNLRLVLLRLERAGAIHQRAARAEQRGRPVEQATLERDERLDVLRLLEPRNVRVAPDSSGRHAGRVEQNRIDGAAL